MHTLRELGPSERITDVVYRTLRDAILRGDLRAGQSLSVPELARQLGVSRSPVREAVLQLVTNGLGHSEPRKGVVVTELTESDLTALHEIREPLESLSARWAAANVGEDEIQKLEALMRRQAQARKTGDAELYVETDCEFHETIAKCSRDPRLIQFLRVLSDQMRIAVRMALTDPSHVLKGHEEHLAVLAALKARNPRDAQLAMHRHISSSRHRELQTLRRRS